MIHSTMCVFRICVMPFFCSSFFSSGDRFRYRFVSTGSSKWKGGDKCIFTSSLHTCRYDVRNRKAWESPGYLLELEALG